MSTVDITEEINPSSGDQKISVNIDEEPNYDEIDDITPLPLYALIAADSADSSDGAGQRAQDIGKASRSFIFEAPECSTLLWSEYIVLLTSNFTQ